MQIQMASLKTIDQKVELTFDEIAKKFGLTTKQLKIKK